MICQYHNMDELENALTKNIVAILKESISTKNHAKILLSGGNTPKGLYHKLSLQDLQWSKIHVGLVDERFVEKNSQYSNEKMIREVLLQNKASKANLTGMIFETDYKNNLDTAKTKYQYFLNSDVLLLGMGNDGHTASLFPNDESSQNACEDQKADLVNTNAPVKPVQRITLNKKFIYEADNVFLMFNGQDKSLVFEKSVENTCPIHHFIPKLNAVYYATK